MIKKAEERCDDTKSPQKYKNKPIQICRYCGTMHKPYRCLAFAKDCKNVDMVAILTRYA